MNPLEEDYRRLSYVQNLMIYIEMEYDNIPDTVTPEMAVYFNQCFEDKTCFPNAAGVFVETFMKTKA